MYKALIEKKGKTIRKKAFLEHGYELFTKYSIESVTLQDVADASGHGVATLYRYFNTKAGFVVAVAEYKWKEFFEWNRKRRPKTNFEGMSALELYEFYLDSFLALYRNNKDLLRFNQFFNIYARSEDFETHVLDLYHELLNPIINHFHEIYKRAKIDHTIKTDESEHEMLTLTLHLMLAVVTRYAVGLAYEPENSFDEDKELEAQKQMLLLRYKN